MCVPATFANREKYNESQRERVCMYSSSMSTYSSLDDFLLVVFRVKKCIREIFMKLSGFKKYK